MKLDHYFLSRERNLTNLSKSSEDYKKSPTIIQRSNTTDYLGGGLQSNYKGGYILLSPRVSAPLTAMQKALPARYYHR